MQGVEGVEMLVSGHRGQETWEGGLWWVLPTKSEEQQGITHDVGGGGLRRS